MTLSKNTPELVGKQSIKTTTQVFAISCAYKIERQFSRSITASIKSILLRVGMPSPDILISKYWYCGLTGNVKFDIGAGDDIWPGLKHRSIQHIEFTILLIATYKYF
ncbi:MAG: hypothetical protein A2461_09085 [Burkholderiales bacterium RIFOXYC2_FULL_59_8]|nr:MAG: hypothetical protein A2461_09085 [Burkholderiales bacterium RIFOXYC2_FULL_59_8]OGB50081.1 MAG: hypothetical protein A2503_18565 [Burkholderiales bacterium RIFOXYD12_FULL_59_19]OGB76998.1 MAG: hypothetical protein A2496_07180 [Burkholderiales bacterium RIFOXYC12_FULL_60_6]OGB85943.1 MAG: hypothetical protein A2535_06205 [Burkholderiales bacterium RIFOXYD2_FULL_59_8]